jgi:hypothetical protein
MRCSRQVFGCEVCIERIHPQKTLFWRLQSRLALIGMPLLGIFTGLQMFFNASKP